MLTFLLSVWIWGFLLFMMLALFLAVTGGGPSGFSSKGVAIFSFGLSFIFFLLKAVIHAIIY